MLTLTQNAEQAINRFINSAEQEMQGIRVEVKGGGCSGMQYALSLEKQARADDIIMEFAEVKVFIDPHSAPLLSGVTIDFLDSMETSGFKFENPNATNSCGCGSSFSC